MLIQSLLRRPPAKSNKTQRANFSSNFSAPRASLKRTKNNKANLSLMEISNHDNSRIVEANNRHTSNRIWPARSGQPLAVTFSQTGKHTNKQANTQTNRQSDKQTNEQTDKQADRYIWPVCCARGVIRWLFRLLCLYNHLNFVAVVCDKFAASDINMSRQNGAKKEYNKQTNKQLPLASTIISSKEANKQTNMVATVH